MKPSDTVRVYESFDELVASAEKGMRGHPSATIQDKDDRYDRWIGSPSWEEGYRLAREGWAEIRPQVDALTDHIAETVREMVAPQVSTFLDVSGSSVDIGAYMNSEPECMMNFVEVEVPQSGRVVKVVIDAFTAGGIDPEDIKKRGCAIVAFLEVLGTAGYATEVWLQSTVTNKGGRWHYHTCIKLSDATQRLDVDGLMFAIAHPSSLRRMIFGSWENETEEIRQKVGATGPNGFYGMRAPLDHEVSVTADANVWVAPIESRHDYIIADAQAWIRDTLTSCGIQLADEG